MSLDYAITALVPMKEYSERVPSKNIRNFGGKPLFYYILETLESATFVNDIIVDTDSSQIISYLEKDFPEVNAIERPEFLIGNKVPMTPIIEYDIKYAKTEHFIQTHATNPLLKSSTIDYAIESYFKGLEKGYDSIIGVTRYQTRFYDHNKQPINHDPNVMIPSQDMQPLYEDNSNFYINSIENFLKNKNRVGKNPSFIEVSKLESIDIDEEEDFLIAEAILNFTKLKNKNLDVIF